MGYDRYDKQGVKIRQEDILAGNMSNNYSSVPKGKPQVNKIPAPQQTFCQPSMSAGGDRVRIKNQKSIRSNHSHDSGSTNKTQATTTQSSAMMGMSQPNFSQSITAVSQTI